MMFNLVGPETTHSGVGLLGLIIGAFGRAFGLSRRIDDLKTDLSRQIEGLGVDLGRRLDMAKGEIDRRLEAHEGAIQNIESKVVWTDRCEKCEQNMSNQIQGVNGRLGRMEGKLDQVLGLRPGGSL